MDSFEKDTVRRQKKRCLKVCETSLANVRQVSRKERASRSDRWMKMFSTSTDGSSKNFKGIAGAEEDVMVESLLELLMY